MVLRITADWTGNVTGLASSTFYFVSDDPGPQDPATAQAAATKVRNFFLAVRTILAPGVVINVNPVASVISTQTGQLQSQVGVDGGAAITAQGSSGYARAAGGLVRLTTSTFLNGRTLKGRIFVVPLAGEGWANTGMLSTAGVNGLTAAGAALLAAGPGTLVVWHRPKQGAGGSIAAVTSTQVPAEGAILTSRRD